MIEYRKLQNKIEAVSLELKPQKYSEKLFHILCKELNFKYGSVLIFDDRNKAQVIYSYNLPEYHPIFFDNVKFEKFVEIDKANNDLNTPFSITDFHNKPFFLPWKVIISSLDLKQIVFVPLKSNSKVVGVMVLYTELEEELSNEQLTIIEQFTFFLSYSIFVVKLVADIKNEKEAIEKKLQESNKKTISLKNSEKQYKELIENMGEGLALVDKEENFLFVNSKMEKIFGVEQYELMGRNIIEFMKEKEFDKILKQIEIRKLGKKTKYQIKIITPNGETKTCSVTATPYFNEDGEFIGSFGLYRDITAAKWAESIQNVLYRISESANTCETLADLFKSIHDNLGALMNTNNFYIALYDDESKLISFPYYVDEFELPPAPRKLKNGLTEYVLNSAKPLLATKQIKDELKNIGEIEPRGAESIDWLGVPLKISNNTIGVLAIQSYSENIRFGENEKNILVFVSEQIAMAIEKKKSEESLKLKQKQLNEAQKIAKLGSWEINLMTNQTFFSDNFFDILEIDSEFERVNFNFAKHLEFIHEEDKQDFESFFDLKNTPQLPHFNIDYRIISLKGNMKFLNSVGLIKYDEENRPLKITLTIQDITEQKAKEILVKEMEITKKTAEMKQQFLANVSHEIRTPLNAIIGFAKLLEKNIEDEQNISYVKTISDSSNTLLVLINDILDLSKIESGNMEIKYAPVAIEELIAEINRIFSLKVKDKNIKFDLLLNKDFPKCVYLDETRIRQILLNLVGNAIKFTDDGFVKIIITHQYSPKDKSLVDIIIEVQDSGIGIPEDQKEVIFESFRQINGQNQKKYGGTGLGLSITKKLVEIMGGMISFSSSIGVGSIFKVEIPQVLIASDEDKDRISAEYLEEKLPYQDVKLLILNHNQISEKLVVEFTDRSDIVVIGVENNLDDIEKGLGEKPDIIMVNLIGHDISRSELLYAVKKYDCIKKTPLIAILDDTIEIDLNKMKELGIDGIIRKSFSLSEIRQALFKYLTFKKKSEKHERSIEKVDLSQYLLPLNDWDAELLQQVVDTLKKKYLTEFNQINKFPRIKQIKEVSLSLIKFGKKKNIEILWQYGNKLNEEAGSFNISRMKKLSEYFPEIVKMIESKIGN